MHYLAFGALPDHPTPTHQYPETESKLNEETCRCLWVGYCPRSAAAMFTRQLFGALNGNLMKDCFFCGAVPSLWVVDGSK